MARVLLNDNNNKDKKHCYWQITQKNDDEHFRFEGTIL